VRCAIAAQSRFRERDRFLGTGSGVAVNRLYANPVMTRGTSTLFATHLHLWCRDHFRCMDRRWGRWSALRRLRIVHSQRTIQTQRHDSGVVIVIDFRPGVRESR